MIKPTLMPLITVLSTDNEDVFRWTANAWNQISGHPLLIEARNIIAQGATVPEVIKLLRAAGFAVARLITNDSNYPHT